MRRASREAVGKRARDRCEYCRINQADAPFVKHQIEHINRVSMAEVTNSATLRLRATDVINSRARICPLLILAPTNWFACLIHENNVGVRISQMGNPCSRSHGGRPRNCGTTSNECRQTAGSKARNRPVSADALVSLHARDCSATNPN
jgi:hypothetical protein